MAVEALGVYGLSVGSLEGGGHAGVRFFTIATCFLAATICGQLLAMAGVALPGSNVL